VRCYITDPKILAIISLMVVTAAIAGYTWESNTASSTSQQASVTISPVIAIMSYDTINFGTVPESTVGPTSLTAKNTLIVRSNMPVDVYTRANDTKMINTNPTVTDTITPIQFTPHDGSATDYTTKYQMAYENLLKPEQGSEKPATWDEILNIKVLSYTNNGTYVVTLYHAAVPHGAAPPTRP